MMTVHKPLAGEYDPYTILYIDNLPDDGLILKHLEENADVLRRLMLSLTPEQSLYRYAPGKWTIKEILLHIIDSERVFVYRALRIARNDATPLAGYDQDPYVAASGANERSMESLLEEYTHTRRSTLSFFSSLSGDAWMRSGTANNKSVTVRALAYIIAGHELHHLKIINGKYLAR
ncbi:MAG: DinB family protein [Bacteroidota bacterium]